ncbi:ABC transporter permease [Microbacteriaceae bacterium VKM Ac-2854]|nr:ABC transporter permease [Microbacteriaceae bacterium VKM Ac-2854]
MTETSTSFGGLPPTPTPTTAVATIAARRSRRGKYAGVLVLAKRAGIYLITFVGAVTLNFLLPRVMPGDPVQKLVNNLQATTGQPVPPETVEAIRGILGDPHKDLATQYVQYWGNLLRGDLGVSTSHYPIKVTELIGQALPWTIGLVVVFILIAWVIGVGLGAVAGWNRGTRTDGVISLLCSALVSFPPFWAAMVLQFAFAFQLHLLPAGGAADPSIVPGFSTGYILSVLEHALLPGLTLAVVSFAGYAFSMRNMMALTIADDFVLLGRAKGLRPWRVLTGYAGRNAVLPSVSALAQSIGGSIGGVLLIEFVFTYPGLGSLMGGAIAGSDFPVIQAVFLVATIAVLVMNFVADSVYVFLDPRTREVAN